MMAPAHFPSEAASFPNPEAEPFRYKASYPPPPVPKPLSSSSFSSSAPLISSPTSYTAAFPTPVEAYQRVSKSSCPSPPILPSQRHSPVSSFFCGKPSPRAVSSFGLAGKSQSSRFAINSHGSQARHHASPTICPLTKASREGNCGNTSVGTLSLHPHQQKKPNPLSPSSLVIQNKPFGLFGPIPKAILKEGHKQRIAGVDVLRLQDGTILPRIDGSSLQQLLHTNPGAFPQLEKTLTAYFIEKMRHQPQSEDCNGPETPFFSEGRYALAERLRQEVPMFKNMKLAHLIRMVQLASWKKLLTYRDKALVPVAACPVAAREFIQRNCLTAPGSQESATALATVAQLLRALGRIVDPAPTGIFLAQVKDLVRWTTYERLDCMVLGHTKLQDLLLSEPFIRYYRLYTPEGNEHCTYIQSKRYPLPRGAVLHTRSSMIWDREACPMEPPLPQCFSSQFPGPWDGMPSLLFPPLCHQRNDTSVTSQNAKAADVEMANEAWAQRCETVHENSRPPNAGDCEMPCCTKEKENNFDSASSALDGKTVGEQESTAPPAAVLHAASSACDSHLLRVPDIKNKDGEREIPKKRESIEMLSSEPHLGETDKEESDSAFQWIEEDIVRLVEEDCSQLEECNKSTSRGTSPWSDNSIHQNNSSFFCTDTNKEIEPQIDNVGNLSTAMSADAVSLASTLFEDFPKNCFFQGPFSPLIDDMQFLGEVNENGTMFLDTPEIWYPDLSLYETSTERDYSESVGERNSTSIWRPPLQSFISSSPDTIEEDKSSLDNAPEKRSCFIFNVPPVDSGTSVKVEQEKNSIFSVLFKGEKDDGNGSRTSGTGEDGLFASGFYSGRKTENACSPIFVEKRERAVALSSLMPSFFFGFSCRNFSSEDEDIAPKTPSTSCEGQYSIPSPPSLKEVTGEESESTGKKSPEEKNKDAKRFSGNHIRLVDEKEG
ncbi:OST-HTH associated domain protein [Toxoplasma gondii CAST]|uniref:OST-HTH associated domain protein n=1 Tax=Toxoplasma gondii CAST TaxID=943122 RepID=A0A425I315_TOXGO|nr:OST-HTH associated domain protein [Toxoplasma gondii CAST]